MKIVYQELIKAPAAKIYELIADVEQHPRWLNACTSAAWSGSARGMGATFTQTTQGQAREGIVTLAEEGKRAGFSFSSGQGQANFTFDFELEGVSEAVTKLKFTMEIELQGSAGSAPGCMGFFLKLLGSRITEASRTQLQGSFTSLKRLAEGGE